MSILLYSSFIHTSQKIKCGQLTIPDIPALNLVEAIGKAVEPLVLRPRPGPALTAPAPGPPPGVDEGVEIGAGVAQSPLPVTKKNDNNNVHLAK